MNLLIIRHAKAFDRTEWAERDRADAERPLTEEGWDKFAEAVEGLRTLIAEIDLIYTSPLIRAQETAFILHQAYPQAVLTQSSTLSPGAESQQLIKELGRLPADATVALVGHEPDLSRLLTYLITTQESPVAKHSPFVELKKGSLAWLKRLESESKSKNRSSSHRYQLQALLPGKILRGL